MPEELKRSVIQTAEVTGAGGVGVAGRQRRADGRPSAELWYLLPGEESVVSFWVPLAQEKIRPFLTRKDCSGYVWHLGDTYRAHWTIGDAIRQVLVHAGEGAVNVWPDEKYRPSPNPFELGPDFSHRYGAVAAGIGVSGRSGNVLVPGHGPRVLWSSVVISARLAADPMMEEKLCNDCKLCAAVCQVGMMSATETTAVRLGGRDHVIARKGSNGRCGICCGNSLGQQRYQKWSTWSPERLEIPETDLELQSFFIAKVAEWYQSGDGRSRCMVQGLEDRRVGLRAKLLDQFDDTCGFCQLVRFATHDQRKKNYETIPHSGIVVRGEDGKPVVVRSAVPQKKGAGAT